MLYSSRRGTGRHNEGMQVTDTAASTRVDVAPEARPFLKWAGGKRSLLPEIMQHVPSRVRCYYEPFVGGGAVFFHLVANHRFEHASINDTNGRLIRTYGALQDEEDVEVVIRKLGRMRNNAATFERVRARKVDNLSAEDCAAWLIYLNRTCYNGLYRVNAAGQFNAPYGGYPNPRICDPENLRACQRVLHRTHLHDVDFEQHVEGAGVGDFVYFDPPYMPRAGKEFVGYQPGGFTREDHVRLRDCALQLKERGAKVLLSNSDTEEVRDLYAAGFEHRTVQGRRTIGADQFRRGRVPDLLIW